MDLVVIFLEAQVALKAHPAELPWLRVVVAEQWHRWGYCDEQRPWLDPDSQDPLTRRVGPCPEPAQQVLLRAYSVVIWEA